MKNKAKQTKFPVARIKRIMQKDEEVGKVAQATPIVISKALELFLQLIVEESYKVTEHRGARRVEAYHLKHAVETTEMLDFLREIVETVPDPSAGGTIDLDGENGEGQKKRRGKGKRTASNGEGVPKKRRRKKADPEGDTDMHSERDADEDEDGSG
ncbi:histone-fold-containing protein [Fistulina hepatica ATCC 64428]|uniref:Histone-fold-containing protein n=1 Tax=Fistulina hepatica ATCC 64428 TaxID=1128425 RepID=A0A0D7A1Q6_9AGAR|nr:histone-fold-containing protein [Fistulina hepatica ATCC 64428]